MEEDESGKIFDQEEEEQSNIDFITESEKEEDKPSKNESEKENDTKNELDLEEQSGEIFEKEREPELKKELEMEKEINIDEESNKESNLENELKKEKEQEKIEKESKQEKEAQFEEHKEKEYGKEENKEKEIYSEEHKEKEYKKVTQFEEHREKEYEKEENNEKEIQYEEHKEKEYEKEVQYEEHKEKEYEKEENKEKEEQFKEHKEKEYENEEHYQEYREKEYEKEEKIEKEAHFEEHREKENENEKEENNKNEVHSEEDKEKEYEKKENKEKEEQPEKEEGESKPELEKNAEEEKQTEKELEKENEQENKSEKEIKPEEEKKTESEKESQKDSEKENEIEDKSEKEKENVKETYNEDKSLDTTINIPTNIQIKTDKQDSEETDETKEEDKKESNITLSFRQINNFKQNILSKIEFDLYTLTIKENLSKGFEIPVFVNLIHIEGQRDEENTEAKCILENDIIENKVSTSVHFHCSIDNLNARYYSFRYNYSDYIFGVPDDEKALDPILTKKGIENNEFQNITEKIELPPTFIIDLINQEKCNEKGIMTFIGNISRTMLESIQFNLPLLYPEGASLFCNLTENGLRGEMECKTDREIKNKIISFEQRLIKEGIEEVLLISSFSAKEQVTCENAIFKQASEKSTKTISFRQVSHYTEISDGFSFYFIILASKEYKKGYELYLEMALDINKKIIKRNANCILEETVTPEEVYLAQGIFLCSMYLSSEEQRGINISNIKITTDNEEIDGVSNLNEITANPYRTDLALKEINDKRARNDFIDELAYLFDYYTETVKLNKIFNIEYIKEIDKCEETGKFILEGTFTDNITEDIKFDLPLTYPIDEVKCELSKAKKGEKKDIICKASLGFKNIDYIIFEQRIITKKNKEVVIIPNKIIKLDRMINCINYNSAKIPIIKQRYESGISLLQLSKFIPEENNFKYFMAVTRKEQEIQFKTNYNIPVNLIFSSETLLRHLEEIIYGIESNCNLNKELQSKYAAGYDCVNKDSFEGTPESMEIDANKITDIQGIPDRANPDKLVYNIDYSILQNLKNIDNIPIAQIHFINADSCPKEGEFKINATLNQIGNLKNEYSDVEIKFSLPETSGICEINIQDKNLNMTCQNTENFYITQVFIERQVVQDSEGNEIFFIENFINPEQFSCDLSINLNTKIRENNNSVVQQKYYNRSKDGLNGAHIALIVIIPLIAILLTVIISVNIIKKKKKKVANTQDDLTFSHMIMKI